MPRSLRLAPAVAPVARRSSPLGQPDSYFDHNTVSIEMVSTRRDLAGEAVDLAVEREMSLARPSGRAR
jgi:hypothetical protein